MPAAARHPGLRAALLFGAPTLALIVSVVLPLILGRETLILRDVLELHLMLKAPQAEALRDGVFPIIDPSRAGGQPLAGNPNAVPFYPDNVLYAVAPVLWALNAHFWLHWLLAPLAAFWMGRAWGLSRSASWAVGVCYGVSGFFLSQLNLYNLVAGSALVPALVAATLRSAEPPAGRPRWAAPAAGLLWALILLSGEPTPVLAGAGLAGSALLVRRRRESLRPRTFGPLLVAGLLGTLVALPQIVELLRVLPDTYRGYHGFADWRLTIAAWRPVHALEWLVPLSFGRYELRGMGGFWGASLFSGNPPLFLSLYPGMLALGLVFAGGVPKTGRAWWAWGAVASGLLLAAGGGHPLGRWLFDLPGLTAFRYPVKLILVAAVPASLLCGIGWERALGEGGRLRRLGWPLAAVGAVLAGVWGFLVRPSERFEALVLRMGPGHWTDAFAAAERARWIATLVILAALLAGLALALVLARRRPLAGAALLLAIHAAGQVHLLRGLVLTDEADAYTRHQPPLEAIAPGAVVAHAEYFHLFGPSNPRFGPDPRMAWALRQDFYALIPSSGVLHGLRYELNRSVEGLESFLARIAYEAISNASSDTDRIRALSRWGVGYVITDEPLVDVPEELARLAGAFPGVTYPVHVYRLAGVAPEVLFAEELFPVPHLNGAWDLFRSPGFDPDRHVVLPGPDDGPVPEPPEPSASPQGPPGDSIQGQVRVLSRGPESLEVETASPVPGVLVVQRSLLPVWRGAVDGDPVELEPANLYRIGVRVPAGRHRVRLWVDRRPLVLSGIASALGLLGLAAWGLPGLRRGRPPADTISGP